MAIDNSITFGGINSADFGIYISGEGVFNAPQRDVEMISVPGRNGAIALDRGRFQNIEVTYPAFNYEADYDTFQQQLSDFRNAICAQKGYNRLSDTFHPDEYRMATYLSGLEVKPIKYNTASEFNIVFNCKPQRYLTSGEEEIDVTDWSDVKTLSGESVTFDDGDTSKGFQSIKTVFNPSQDGTPWKSEVESAPYLFRQSSGNTVSHEYDSESDAIVGGTVAWNQLVKNGNFETTDNWYPNPNITFTVSNNIATSVNTGSSGDRYNSQSVPFINGHKYLYAYDAWTDNVSGNGGAVLLLYYGDANSVIDKRIYEANKWFTFNGIVNCTGSLNVIRLWNLVAGATHKYKNIYIIDLTALFGSSTIADYLYSLEQTTAGSGIAKLKEWGFLVKDYYEYDAGSLQSVNTSAHIMRDADDVIIGNYPLDSDLELRGIPKLDSSNNLDYDGDVYEPSGSVTRGFGIRAYQSGDESLADAITDGTNTVYKLSTPTTETADPFTAIQTVDPYGTEQYIDYGVSQGTRDIAVPVGHQTKYIQRVPIEGKTQMKTYVSPTNSVEDATIYTTNLNGIKYGGSLDVISGKLDKTHEGITYTGQTINEPWLSDCDEYQQGATPTYGATVVYELTTPTRVYLTAQAVAMLDGTNVVRADADSVEVKYGFKPGILYNPTRFDAQPLLEVTGYGDIEFNGYKIELENGGRYDYVTLVENETKERVGTNNHEEISLTYPLDLRVFNTGDRFWANIQPTFWFTTSTMNLSDTQVSISGIIEEESYTFMSHSGGTGILAIPTNPTNGFVKGTSLTYTGDLVLAISGNRGHDFSATVHAAVAKIYDADASTLTFTASIDISDVQGTESMQNSRIELSVGASGFSTRTILGNPTYIDCGLGEAYRYLDGEVVSLNRYIDLGSDLPVLAPGVNEITYPSSVRGLLIKPNWWKI